MERKVFTYKDVEEARKYIGKRGLFTQDYQVAVEGPKGYETKTVVSVLDHVNDYGFVFVPDEKDWKDGDSNYQFFVPDPEPVEKWVPFTADDSPMFAGKFIRDAVSWEDKLGSMIVAYHLEGVNIIAPGDSSSRKVEYSELWVRYVFLDGTRCGKKVTE